MSTVRAWFARLGGLFGKERRDRELAAELESHLQMHSEDNLRAGMTPEEARRQAMLKLGGVEQTKESYRDYRGIPWLDTFMQDVRFGLRMLRKNPGFAAVAVLTLALGIGANTAIFSVIDGVLLNPVPFPQANRVFSVHSKLTVYPRAGVSYPNYLDWERENKSFEELAAWRSDDFTMGGAEGSELLSGEMVSSNFFTLLRVKPILGRFFRAEEDQTGAARVAIISEGLWKRKFSGDPNICGKTLALDGKAYTITGVIPSRFPLIRYTPNPDRQFDDVFVPIGQWDYAPFRNRQIYYGTEAIGRLKDGVTLEQARAEMDGIARGLEAAYPKDDDNVRVNIMPLSEDIAGDLHPALLILWGAVSLVLLIACANVANLLLARSVGRRREFGVRIALGASRGRIARQLLIENMLLAAAGGALGVVAAAYGVRGFLWLFPSVLPSFARVGINWRVLIFALAASFVTGILCGLVPALGLSREAPQEALRDAGRGVLAGRHALQRIFVGAEVGLALALLIGAALLIRSFAHVWAVDPGFDPHNVLTFGVELSPGVASNPAQIRSELQQLNERFAATPGVDTAGFAMGTLPMAGDAVVGFWPHGKPRPEKNDDLYRAQYYTVNGEYFQAMRIPLIHGRVFMRQDDLSAPSVAIVDEEIANRIFAGQDPVGQQIEFGPTSQPIQIVGVAGHVKHWGLDGEGKSPYPYEIYLPYAQIPGAFLPQSAHFTWAVVRTKVPPLSLAASLRHELAAADPGAALYGLQTMDGAISRSLGQRRFSMALLSIFATVALILAMIGVYGVVSYLVGLRTREIGIRMALGAQQRDVLRLVLSQNGITVLAGIGMGLVASLGLMRLMASMLFGISATDPLTFAVVAAILLCVALVACWIPARRAMRVDPMVALRYE
jgi:predicted permease